MRLGFIIVYILIALALVGFVIRAVRQKRRSAKYIKWVMGFACICVCASIAQLMTSHRMVADIAYGGLENETYGDDWIRFRTDEPFICEGDVPFATPFRAMEHLFIKDLLSMLAAENFFQNQFKEFTILSLFQILFNKLRESLSNKAADFQELALQQLHMNIISNPSFPWSVPDMAKQLYICPRHLQKLYQKRYGTSCMEDVIKHRLLMTKEKIASGNLPIYKIAEQCGYSNTEHFSRQFKNRFGISPKAYREKKKKDCVR